MCRQGKIVVAHPAEENNWSQTSLHHHPFHFLTSCWLCWTNSCVARSDTQSYYYSLILISNTPFTQKQLIIESVILEAFNSISWFLTLCAESLTTSMFFCKLTICHLYNCNASNSSPVIFCCLVYWRRLLDPIWFWIPFGSNPKGSTFGIQGTGKRWKWFWLKNTSWRGGHSRKKNQLEE